MLPVRFFENVGIFFDDAQSNRGRPILPRGKGPRGMLPWKIFENCNANRAILQHLGQKSLHFPFLKLTSKDKKPALYKFFSLCIINFH